ncbi:sigma-70 family RNA polymerase sigma factor [Lysinibacillus capsici]|uniref:sigma-70 family RNA polymerase sigma factor n=1 Tax=Lysinibacillus capsici TaxID=2115968 RepID=UPI002A81AAB3|nr:sigma-70 family RNA polymerase sigma factor [Lysinibacillus capsici]
MPITYREVVILYYYQELKVREIADILTCAENTVKTRLHRARKMLQEKLVNSEWEVLMDDNF